jgi:CBS domain-containing protein
VTVTDDWGRVTGILSIADLLRAIMPGYLTAPRPTTADTIQYSPLFWTGMFTREVKALEGVEVADVMGPSPPTVDADAPLLEAAYQMVHTGERRLLVMRDGEVAGVIREQDLFFEMDRILES